MDGALLVRSLTGHGTTVATSLTWSPDGAKLASTYLFAAARLWDVERGQSDRLLETRSAGLSIAWRPGTSTVALRGESRALVFVDVETGKITSTTLFMDAHNVSWSPDGKRLATTGSSDCGVYSVGSELDLSLDFRVDADRTINQAQWFPDSKHIAVWRDGVDLFEADTGRWHNIIPAFGTWATLALKSNEILAVGSGDYIFLVDLVSSQLTHQLEGHLSEITNLSFSYDGRMRSLATVGF